MDNQALTSGLRRSKRVLIAVGILGLIVVAALAAGGLAFLRFSGHNLDGLEGTWRDTNNPQHIYEFQPNGELDTWTGSRSWWNKLGWSATWRRKGQQITIRTDRNWDFEGRLDGGTIRGTIFMRDETGATVTTAEGVWQKE